MRVAHVVSVVHVAVDRETVDAGQRQCILGEENYRNELLLQTAEDMAVVEHAFVEDRSQDQGCDQVAGDDVCRCPDDRTDLLLAEEHRELPACPREQHQQDRHFELHMPMLQVRQNVLSAAPPR